MRYHLYDYQNNLILETDDLEDVASETGRKASTLYVKMSAGKGTFSFGKARVAFRLQDMNRSGPERQKPGPKVKAYRYAATYPDEYPDTFTEPTHEVTLEEIARVVKTTPEAITQKFALHQKVFALIPEQNSYRTKPVVFKRLAPNPELDTLPSETRPVLTERLTTA
ncbi:MAG: hypothetical protein A4E20_12145 [Nitrospira sp. SG-bin2]|uniref:hypothetical protein n=1 Tax=Nitrospira cf. moscoviensis SBR1015 TaxID=96242 RepID=UPI000A0C77A1|nr:hypothetical protein [Nitrospira cf. moscoviensis SBR1015]OQW33972.1 MAG: hypothetical protein A4E20_12145 [Nitrospira sp. SG-bin2]